MPRAGDAFLLGALPRTNDPLVRLNFNPPDTSDLFNIDAFVQMWEDFLNTYLFDIIDNVTGLDLSSVAGLINSISDMFFSSFIGLIPGALAGLTGSAGLGSVFGDLLGLLGDPIGLGSGSPGLPGVGSIPLFGGLIDEGLTFFTSLIPGLDASQIVSGQFPAEMIFGLTESIEQGVGVVVDQIYNAITFGANASGVAIGTLGAALTSLAQGVETGMSLATRAFDATAQFGGMLHQLIDSLPVAPIYNSFEHFIEQMLSVLSTTVDNIFTSLSPQNPATAQNSVEIAALWAHVSASNTAGIHYNFDSAVPLTNNYPGTTNPAWATLNGTMGLPTVPSGENYVVSSSGNKGMVFVGNPNSAATDHGLVTNRNQVYATLKAVKFGQVALFLSGHLSGGVLGQGIYLLLGYGGPAAMRLYKCTSVPDIQSLAGMTQVGAQWDMPGVPKDNDVFGFQHDGSGTYQMYYNNEPVGDPITPTGLTFGDGYRECGAIVADSGGGPGIGLAGFTALDYTT